MTTEQSRMRVTDKWRKCRHGTGFGILVLAAVGRSVRVEGRGGGLRRGRGSLVMRGRGGRRGLCQDIVLTAVMHGVAGDDHR